MFTIKYNLNDEIDLFKFRLVEKGFIQTKDIDYQETFVPIAKLNMSESCYLYLKI